jgi:hypothetical protein
MKKRLLLLSMLFVFLLPAFAQDYYKFKLPGDSETIYATWVNEKYDGAGRHLQKKVFASWGYGESFKKITDEKPSFRFTFILVEKWTDSKGNVWYKELEQMLGQKNCILCKISKDGNTLETVFRSAGFPSESDLNPSSPSYVIYTRQ